MNGPKLLIDTNILIGLEDHTQISPDFSRFIQLCQQYGVQTYIHEASKQDVERDKNVERREVILSKLDKFLPLNGFYIPGKEELELTYGPIRKPNDHVDVVLLYALHEVSAVDFLITEDQGVHKRARNVNVADRVFTLEDALVWLRDTYDRVSVALPYIEEKKCHQINRKDDIFASLKSDYAEFDHWFIESCVKKHRDCWTIIFNSEIAGIAIRKDEVYKDLKSDVPSSEGRFNNIPKKILKICTLKIKDSYRGEKLGEQLLKQVLWWAYKNRYEFIYLTVYPKHRYLIDMLTQYGFESIGRTKGELFLGKAFAPNLLKTLANENPLEYHRQYYPAYMGDDRVGKYLIPIKGEYYETLFPENVSKRQQGLFDNAEVAQLNKIPGNTIRKVYICHAGIKSIKEGDILFFFHLKDKNSFHSQALITVGVTDGFDITSHSDELLQLTAKRSVFSPKELVEYTKNGQKKVKVINFLLAGHISPAVFYEKMEEIGIKGPYQTIRSIPHKLYKELEKEIRPDVRTA